MPRRQDAVTKKQQTIIVARCLRGPAAGETPLPLKVSSFAYTGQVEASGFLLLLEDLERGSGLPLRSVRQQ